MFFLTLPLNFISGRYKKPSSRKPLLCPIRKPTKFWLFCSCSPFLSLEKMTRTKYQKESPHRASSPLQRQWLMVWSQLCCYQWRHLAAIPAALLIPSKGQQQYCDDGTTDASSCTYYIVHSSTKTGRCSITCSRLSLTRTQIAYAPS